MKNWMAFFLIIGISLSAAAQTKGYVPRGHYTQRVRVIRVAPVAAYPLYGSGFGFGYGYPYAYSPFWNSPRVIETTPSQLSLKLDEISNDYQYQIKTTRSDKSLSKQERRQKIRDLKHEREDAVIDAKRKFYKTSDDNS